MKVHIQQLLEQAIVCLIKQEIIPADIQPRINIDRTKDKSHGDYANNLALMLAKPAKQNPRHLAELIIANIPESTLVIKMEIAGPGFINFFINPNFLEKQIDGAYLDKRLNVQIEANPQTIVIDYSSPNLAKEMHVGHLRSSIIGDAVARTLEFKGNNVVRQNHVGDWGTQFGMLLAYMEELRAKGEPIENNLANLEIFYRAAKGRFDESEDFATRARHLVVKLQGGNKDCLKLWAKFNETSLSHCQETYQRLGVSLTRADVRGESSYNDQLAVVVEDLDKQGLLQQSQGAKCVFLDNFKNKEGDPLPVIIQKKDGGFLYATSDLAAMRYRQNELNADRILYFVDARQGLHFQQVFEVARSAGFVNEKTSLEHMPFGTVMGEDGRPFKTRSGAVAKLADLLTEAEVRAYELVKEKNKEMSEPELRHIASVVGISSVKYADLSKNRTSDYTFSFDSMLSFEGNTAPYLLYAYTRVVSIFNKAGIEMGSVTAAVSLTQEKEIDLANKLIQFNDIIDQVAKQGMPHFLCSYLFELAGLFSSFYEACPILIAETETQKQSRLKLAGLTAKTLKQGLSLLGINTLERM
ncbi:arginyl-tRNA synthetase [Psychromonas ingrahamii 37]|uniref:Arginine--tRNA ligase n=1 Tax=Psychromonas ingrahamii (strain DSM 17664 / CCUG 51855 / 37) TaxID=357804 RepID=SYR_PSYIN|nr:arginine--tRNA ligase [Psychromonas ingrahamii]A1SQW6.1 RecName: Full=Arginine--tRNA ligase; AltName: Full=Arginyl-tRNA synthetase; Short=ArgRS [Psychromonas ingrahamii 37]ABM01881.1 arginyl-tRNA synthetase [Psychromonas ingrahamii 37]